MYEQQLTNMPSKEDARKNMRWYLFDAKDKTLGRFASEVAKVLKGKHSIDYTPHIDCGDGVIIINADKIKVTGNKEAQKVYYRYTGYMGGLRSTSFRDMKEKNATYILRHAVQGMMPKTRLGRKQLKKLRIFEGDRHKMKAQNPNVVAV